MLQLIKKKLNSGMGQDVIWTFALQITVMLCSFAINKLLATRLSIDDFGQYNVIKRSVQVLSFVMLAGVGIALPRYIPLYRNSQPPQRILPLLQAALIYIIGVSAVVFLGCMLFSKQMQDIIIGQSDNPRLLFLAMGYAFSLAMVQYVYAYYRGTGNFKRYNGTQLFTQLSIVIPLILLPALTVTKVYTAWLSIVAVLVVCYLSRELWKQRARLTTDDPTGMPLRSHLKTIVTYASGRLVADFFYFSLAAFPLIFISNALGLQQTAYYSVGITFVTMVTPLFSIMGIILLPYVSESIAKHELQRANQVISRLALLYFVAAVAITAFLYAFTGFMTSLLFAEGYTVTTDLTRIMILAIFPQTIYLLYRNPIDAISVVPYNTLILGICLTVIIIGFSLSTTLSQFAWVYLVTSVLQGGLSFLTWHLAKKRNASKS